MTPSSIFKTSGIISHKKLYRDSSHIQISWPVVAQAVSYKIYRNDLLRAIRPSSILTWTDSMLWPSTSYGYRVDAINGSGSVISSWETSGITAVMPSSGFPFLPFSATSPWRAPIGANPSVRANSAALISSFVANITNPNMPVYDWGVGIAEAEVNDPKYAPAVTLYQGNLNEHGLVPVPIWATPDAQGDGHLAIYDTRVQREWGFWVASRDGNGNLTTYAGETTPIDGNGITGETRPGAVAANFPRLALVIRPEEIWQGRIDHALFWGGLGLNNTAHVFPAYHHDGTTSDPNTIMQGMRLQLKPSVNVAGLSAPAWVKTIAKAMQDYGMYCGDNAYSTHFASETCLSRGYDAWANCVSQGLNLGGSDWVTGIPWDQFQVLESPAAG